MNSTTGAEATALSIVAFISAERNRALMGENRGVENLEASVGAGRAAWRNAFKLHVNINLGRMRNGIIPTIIVVSRSSLLSQ